MRLSSAAVVVVAASSLPALAVSFRRDNTFADLEDRSLSDIGRKLKDYLHNNPGHLPLGPGPAILPQVEPTPISSTNAPLSPPSLEARGVVHDVFEKAKHKVHVIFHGHHGGSSVPLPQPTGLLPIGGFNPSDPADPTSTVDPSQAPADPTGSSDPTASQDPIDPTNPDVSTASQDPAAPSPTSSADVTTQLSCRGFEKRRSKSKTKSRPQTQTSKPPPKSGGGSTITSILNHPDLPGIVDGIGGLAGTIIAAKQQHDQNELLKQQLAAQQAQAEAQAAQAQAAQQVPPPSTDPAASTTSGDPSPSQTDAPVQRRRLGGFRLGHAASNANGYIPVSQDPAMLIARGKLANAATLANHINSALSSGLNAYNQAVMNGGAGLGGLGTGMIPGYTDPSMVGGAGTGYYARELEDYNSRDLYNVYARGPHSGLNDLD